MERVKLGKITAPVGIRGEVRVYPYTDEITRFSDIKELELEDRPAKVLGVRYQKDMVVLKLDLLPDRNAAETARGKTLYLAKDKLWAMPENTYFVSDLLGCRVYEDGACLGTLSQVVQNTSAQDLYEVEREGAKPLLIPAVKEFILAVDPQEKRIDVKLPEGLLDL